MRLKVLTTACTLAAGLLGFVLFAPPASAHTAAITVSCTSVSFNYNSFSSGHNTVTEKVYVDGKLAVTRSFSFDGSSGHDAVSIHPGSGSHTAEGKASWNTNGETGSGDSGVVHLTCGSPPPPPCPNGTRPNFRWHYSAHNSSGSWSGTKTATCPGWLSQGPQSMEGDLKVWPGDQLYAGYDFTLPGNHASLSLTVKNPAVVFTVHCVSGAAPSPSTITVTMPTQTYSVTDDNWYPSGKQSDSSVWQGALTVPNACGGGQLRLDQGGTFSATLG